MTIKTFAQSLCLTTFTFGLLATNACVVSPYDGQLVYDAAIDFQGFAQNPGATIVLQARNQRTGQWIPFATTTASTSGGSIDGGQSVLYPWSLDDVNTQEIDECVWAIVVDGRCQRNSGNSFAQFRVVEQGSDLAALITYDQGGTQCVSDKVTNEGKSWFSAGWDCRSESQPVLTLKAF